MSFAARLENFPALDRLLERARREGRYQFHADGQYQAAIPWDPCVICGCTPVLHAMMEPFRLCRSCMAWAVS